MEQKYDSHPHTQIQTKKLSDSNRPILVMTVHLLKPGE